MKNKIKKFLINFLELKHYCKKYEVGEAIHQELKKYSRLDTYYTKDEVDKMIEHYLKDSIEVTSRTLATIEHINKILTNRENKEKEDGGKRREKEREANAGAGE